jgi:hypothetical protein
MTPRPNATARCRRGIATGLLRMLLLLPLLLRY